ncbi:MAG TPA: ferritin-like domain-containing protein [Bryobacteraceae bacterium]|nr:ferritin-like domain-containing protein [Bryobacteraceae bacterium]
MPETQHLLIEEMQDLLHAEHQLVKALPKMAKAAHDPELKQAFEKHLEETQGHVQRLEQAFELLGAKPKTKVCKGMQGLVEEGQEKITEGKEKEQSIADLGLAAAAQKVEHYEISGYGTLRAIAEKLGEQKIAKLLSQTLEEEEKTDKLLTQVCAPILDEASQNLGLETETEEAGTRSHKSARSKTAGS